LFMTPPDLYQIPIDPIPDFATLCAMTRPPIDILAIVTATYKYVWSERFYLIRLGIAPFVIAWMNVILVGVIEQDITLLRRGLFMLPSVLVEGWLVAQFLRTVLTNEHWPQSLPRHLPRPIPPAIFLRIRGLLGAIVIYMLCSLVTNASIGSVLTAYPDLLSPGDTTAASPPSPGMGIAFLMLVVAIFQFRLFFLHVPMVINVPFHVYFSMTRPGVINLQMVAVWVAVQIPVLAITFLVLQPVAQASMGTDAAAYAAFLITSGLVAMSQLLLAVLGSTAIAHVVFSTLLQNKAR
jgi:hypothetical protein